MSMKTVKSSILDSTGTYTVSINSAGRMAVEVRGEFLHSSGVSIGTTAITLIGGYDYTGAVYALKVDSSGRIETVISGALDITDDFTRELGLVILSDGSSDVTIGSDWGVGNELRVAPAQASDNTTGPLRTDTAGRLLVTIVDAGTDTERSSISVDTCHIEDAQFDALDGSLLDIKTATETVAGAVSGTELQVDVVTLPSIPAGTNMIGRIVIKGNASGYDLSVKKPAETYGSDTGLIVLGGDGTNLTVLKTNSSGNLDIVGTITANLSATDNAVLDSIDSQLGTIDADTSSLASTVSGGRILVTPSALVAGSATIGNVNVQTNKTILFKSIDNAGASGDYTLVTGVALKTTKILSYSFVVSGAVSVYFKDSGGPPLSGPMSFAANGGIAFPGNVTTPCMESSVGGTISLNVGSAVQVSGHLTYIQE